MCGWVCGWVGVCLEVNVTPVIVKMPTTMPISLFASITLTLFVVFHVFDFHVAKTPMRKMTR